MKYCKKFFYFYLIIIFFSTSYILADTKVEHKIAVLVNEEIITSYDIIQRLKLGAIIQNIEINSQNNQLLVSNVVDELIQEKLKIEKINEYKIKISNEDYLKFENNFFEKNNIKKSEFSLILDENKINYLELKNRLEIELLWNKLISSLYYRLTSVSEMEVDELIKRNPILSEEQAYNLVIQRQLDLQSSKLLRDIMNEATIEYR
tara:strand:- start:127 stop:741 length:615 start_codon:yes stop_codon:yes gene_type:complete